MVESARLESVCASRGTEGSNPSLSAHVLAGFLHSFCREVEIPPAEIICGELFMVKKFLVIVFCAALNGDCSPPRRKLLFDPPTEQEQVFRPDVSGVRIVGLGESFSATLPQDPQAELAWEVSWDKKMLTGSQRQETMCLSDNDDSCLKVIKYEFKAMQAGEALVEFKLKEEDNLITSFTSRVVVVE